MDAAGAAVDGRQGVAVSDKPTLDLQVGDIFLVFILVAIVADLLRQWIG